MRIYISNIQYWASRIRSKKRRANREFTQTTHQASERRESIFWKFYKINSNSKSSWKFSEKKVIHLNTTNSIMKKQKKIFIFCEKLRAQSEFRPA